MLFNSLEFLIFFPLVTFLYFSIPHRFRWILLLIASYYFYMAWKPEYAIILIVSTLIDFFCGYMMGNTVEGNRRKTYLYVSLISNLGLLFTFKYFNFFNTALGEILKEFNIEHTIPAFQLLLPMGISFYTFQTMSYSIDVYHGQIKAEKHLGIFALFVTFFPQLVAGPIERSSNLLPQIYNKKKFSYERITDGLKLMAWGLFKKIVIADRLALFVNHVYNNPKDYDGFYLITATIFFAFQIYCDFSGYSDIAIGSAQVLGFKLMNNFERPYYSKSIADFWRRWHISLSTWFKDYIYIPLGGNRVLKWRWYYNLFITFLISGLWHGANWTFIVWGALHGFYLVFAIITAKIRKNVGIRLKVSKYPHAFPCMQIFTTFLLVCFAWIFFRANNIYDAFYIITHLFSGIDKYLINFINSGEGRLAPFLLGQTIADLVIAICAIALMEIVHLVQRRQSVRYLISKQPRWVRWCFYYFLVGSILFFGVFGEKEFIYFQF